MLHNDTFNKREYVVRVLLKVVKCMTVEDAVNVMQACFPIRQTWLACDELCLVPACLAPVLSAACQSIKMAVWVQWCCEPCEKPCIILRFFKMQAPGYYVL